MQWCFSFAISCSLRTFVFVHRVTLELISWLLSNDTVLPLIKFSPFHDWFRKYMWCLVFLTSLVHFLASRCLSVFSSIILWYWSDVIWTSHINNLLVMKLSMIKSVMLVKGILSTNIPLKIAIRNHYLDSLCILTRTLPKWCHGLYVMKKLFVFRWMDFPELTIRVIVRVFSPL